MSSPQEMWEALPPITRGWLGVSIVSTSLVSFGMLDPYKLVFHLPFIYENFEIWRFLTCFIFFGKFSFQVLIQLFILARFSAAMEVDPFKTSGIGGSADYSFCLLCMGLAHLIIGWAGGFFFMGPALVFSVLYLWSKRNPEAPTNIWGFRFKGSQLPWALIAFNVLIGGSPVNDLLGVAVGHTYYFIVEVMPLSNNNRRMLNTPEWLIRFVHSATGQEYIPPRNANAPSNPARHNWGDGRPLGVNG